jgi:hypothetical protein
MLRVYRIAAQEFTDLIGYPEGKFASSRTNTRVGARIAA